MPALGNVVSQTRVRAMDEIARRASARAELFMLQDHKASLKTRPIIPTRIELEDLGYGRGYRDAMVEVMTWVTNRDADEILAELHDDVIEHEAQAADLRLSEGLTLVNDPPGKPTPWPNASAEAIQAAIDEAEDERFRRLRRHGYGGEG